MNVKEPKVAVFITAYNEDADTLENTISACTLMNYGNKQIYLLDDSTNHELKRTSVALAEKYGIGYAHRENRRGFKAGTFQWLPAKRAPNQRGCGRIVKEQLEAPSFREGRTSHIPGV